MTARLLDVLPDEPGIARSELLLNKRGRTAWMVIGIAILFPPLALVGAYCGLQLVLAGRRRSGLTLVAAGLLVGVFGTFAEIYWL